MSKIVFSEDAWEAYLYWQSQDKKTLKKINTLLKTIQRAPFSGEGKPEPLKGTRSWSRRSMKRTDLCTLLKKVALMLFSVKVIIKINNQF